MTQRVLPFKLETTGERLTAYAGLSVFRSFVHAAGILMEVNRALRGPGALKRVYAERHVEALMLMLQGAGEMVKGLKAERK